MARVKHTTHILSLGVLVVAMLGMMVATPAWAAETLQDGPDDRIVEIVADAIILYDEHGTDAFGIITPVYEIHTNDLYPFVVNGTTWQTVAHGTLPNFVEICCSEAIRYMGDRPFEEIEANLAEDGHTWVEYIFNNPGTGTDQLKRTYLQEHDGFIFGSGYYLPDARVQVVIDDAISNWEEHGDSWFANITGQDAMSTKNPEFVVVVDRVDAALVAIGADDVWIEQLGELPVTFDRPFITAFHEIHRDGRAWIERVTNHTVTGTEQVMRQLWQLHGPYIFISGYYLPDAHAQSAVDLAVQAYRSTGKVAFSQLNNQWVDATRGQTVFVVDTFNWMVEFHQEFPWLAGQNVPYLRDLLEHNIPVQGGVWLEHGGHNELRTWVFVHGGYAFGSTYDIRDAQAQAVVTNLMHLYDNNSTDTLNRVLAIDDTGQFTPFIIEGDPTQQGGGWVEGSDYTDTTWLYHHDGLVFGSGYCRGWYP